MIIEESRDQGCIPVLNELFEKYIDLPYYVLPVLASLQLIGIITGVILLIFLAQNEDLAQADSELDSEFDDDDRDAPMELPKPKLFCIIKQVRGPRTARFSRYKCRLRMWFRPDCPGTSERQKIISESHWIMMKIVEVTS